MGVDIGLGNTEGACTPRPSRDETFATSDLVPVHREGAYANPRMAHPECWRTLSHPGPPGPSMALSGRPKSSCVARTR